MCVRRCMLHVFVLCALLGTSAAFLAANQAGEGFVLLRLEGHAQYRGPDGVWQDASVGVILPPGTRVRTSGDALAVLAFDQKGNSTLTLRAGTMDITRVPNTTGNRGLGLTLHTGRVSASVHAPYASDFVIRTRNALVRVAGTEFGVEFNEGAGASSGIYVFRGAVQVQGLSPAGEPQGEPRAIKAGDRVIANADGSIGPAMQVRLPDENRFAMRVNTDPPEKTKEERPPKERKPREYAPIAATSGFGGAAGTEMIDGIPHSVLIFTPRLQIGRLGIGFYLPAFINPKESVFDVRKWYNSEEYNFDGFGDFVHDFLLKFQYIQWGQKGDPVYVKLGTIDDFVIGNGFIMNKFSNALGFPYVRRIGAQLDLRFHAWGFESMMADVYEAEIMGARVYFTPFRGFFEDFEIGASILADRKIVGTELGPAEKVEESISPKSMTGRFRTPSTPPADDGYGKMLAVGVDASQPLPSLGLLTWKVFADFALQGYGTTGTFAGEKDIGLGLANGGFGFTLGVKGRILFFDYILAYRRLQDGFIAEYFDSFYYAVREERAKKRITDDDNYNGLVFRTGFEFEGVCGIGVNFERYFGSDLEFEGGSYPDNKLGLYAELQRGLIPKFHADFQYDRYGFTAKEFFNSFFGDRTIITARIFYAISEGVEVVATYKRFYDKDGKYTSSYGVETQFGL